MTRRAKGPKHHSCRNGKRVALKCRNGKTVLGKFDQSDERRVRLIDGREFTWRELIGFRVVKGES